MPDGKLCLDLGEHQHRLANRCSLYVKIFTNTQSVKLKHNGIWRWGIYGLDGWGIYGLNGWGIYGLNGWGIYDLNIGGAFMAQMGGAVMAK